MMINKATVKYIQSLQHKKFRDVHNAFIAEGPKVVKELLHTNIFECLNIYCTATGSKNLEEQLTKTYSSIILIVEDYELQKISSLKTSNEILAIFSKKAAPQKVDIGKKITLFLDDLQDPGNLGTIIRTADWFGIETIFCSQQTADCYNPKVVQSTMASLGRVTILYGDIVDELTKHTNITKYAAVINGTDLGIFGKIKEGIIIIGNESKGISKEVQALTDEKITIAKIGSAESLNAAVATAIILYAVV